MKKRFQKLIAICILGILLVGGGNSSFSQSIDEEAISGCPYVYMLDDGKTYYQGEEYFLMTCNYYVKMHMNNGQLVVGPSTGYFGQGSEWSLPDRDYPTTQEGATKYLHAHFKLMREMGFNCVRIMDVWARPRYDSNVLTAKLWHRYSNIPNNDPFASHVTYGFRLYEEYYNFEDGGLQAIKDAISIISEVADAYDIKLIWVLGAEARYFGEAGGTLQYRSIVNSTSNTLHQQYKSFLLEIANEFNENSAVFAWELFHETESFNNSKSNIDKTAVANTVKDLVNAMKQVDKHHYLTVGLFDIKSLYSLGIKPFHYCDFYNYHIYDYINRFPVGSNLQSGLNTNRQIVYLSKTIEFPWMIGEAGVETPAQIGPDGPIGGETVETTYTVSEQEQKATAYREVGCTKSEGGIGYAWWQFHNEASWQNYGLLKFGGFTPVEINTNPPDVINVYGTYKEIVNPASGSVFNSFIQNTLGCNIDTDTYYNLLGTPHLSDYTWSGVVRSNGAAVADAAVSLKVNIGDQYVVIYAFTDSQGYFSLSIPASNQSARLQISKYNYTSITLEHYWSDDFNNFELTQLTLPAKQVYNNFVYQNSLVVNNGETLIIDEPILVLGDIILNENATLIVNSAVYFGDHSYIEMFYGGKIVLNDGALLTAVRKRWGGIYAANYSNRPTEIISSGNVIIAHSSYAVRTLHDVTVNLNGTDFYNNVGDINIKCNNAQMLFRNCDFIQTPSAVDPCLEDPSCDYCVDLFECGQVTFTNCHFDDQRLSSVHINKSGINVENVDKLEVLPNPLMGAQRSSFNNLIYGIRAIANGDGQIIVKNTDFKVARGIYLYNYMGFSPKTITNNTFEVLDFPKTTDKDIGNPGGEEPDEFECQAYGVYVDKNSNKYQIEGNIFKGEDGNADYRYGLIANNTGYLYNEFYRNKFYDLENAVQSININKGDELDEGLQILCNNFNNTRTDIYVTTDNNTAYGGISSLQGSTSSPAGNLFSNGAVCNYNNEMLPLTYFARIDTDPYWNPREWPSSVNDCEQVFVTLIDYSELSNACIDNTQKFPKPVDAGFLRLQMESAEELETAITSMLDDLVDGGNTGLTISSVLHSDDNSAWLTYYELMSKSPYLSDTVLKEVSKKEQGLTAPMIRDILVANPQGIKNKDLQQLLKDRNNQLPDYMITQIESGLGIISAKENLEIQKAEQHVIYEESLKTLVAYYQSVADSLPYAEDSIVSLLCERNEKQYMDVLADYFFTKSDFTSASDIVNRILSVCTLSQAEKDQYFELKDFYQFYYNLQAFYNGDLSNLNAMHIAELKEYENRKGMAAVKATALLIINDASDYIEPVYKPQPVLEDRLFKQNISIKSNPYFSVYPNPAKEYIYVRYMLIEQIGALQIAITDVSGKMYLQKELIHLQDIVILKTVDLPEGSYNCSLYNGNKLVYNSKIIISK